MILGHVWDELDDDFKIRLAIDRENGRVASKVHLRAQTVAVAE